MTLKDRLQDELIGTTTDATALLGNTEAAFAINRLRDGQRQALQPTVANIEADLKGLLREKLYHPLYCGLNDNRACDCENAQMSAAIEHYCKGDKE